MRIRRREFISIPVYALGSQLVGRAEVPLRFFTAAEAEVIQAASARIFPSDENGPGATEAGVVIYIDRQLAGPYGRDKYRYTKGPWVESVPEHGYQGKENPRQIYRQGIEKLGNFVTLTHEQQDERLMGIENTMFFRLLRTHTIEGMFCDPMHGGNRDMVGWKLIGFPGPVMSYRDELEPFLGKPYRVKPKSLEQIVGHPVKVMEDEKD
jgi:gluconate 2-dehydrogenase gamma chain